MYTEAQVREYVQGIIDTVAGLSTQASKVEGLEAQVNHLAQRVRELEQANYDLQMKVHDAGQNIQGLQSDLAGTQTALDNERAISGGLRDTIVQRDARVTELSHEKDENLNRIVRTERERDEARNTVNDLNVLVDELRRKFTAAQEDATHWHGEANKLTGEVTSMQAQFERLRGILAPPVVPSADVA